MQKVCYLLGGRRAYKQVVSTHKMEVAYLSSFVVVVIVVVARHWNSVLLVSRGQQRQLHIRLTERELNGIAIHFPSTIAENFREFIDKLHDNYCRRVNHVFKGNTVTDRDSTRKALNCAKQVTEG